MNAIDNKKEIVVPTTDTIKMTRAEVANVQQLAWKENINLKIERKKGGSMVTAPIVFLSKLGFYPF
jgi:hypothetical protein